MRFYDALQLDPAGLKKNIREAETRQEKTKMLCAMIARSFLIVLFSVLVISPVTPVFGAENSPMAVALLCVLLGIRFVDLGYRIQDSMINLAVVFALLLFAPVAAAAVNPFFAALIHISAFFVILFMTSDRPEMGNAGIYTFAYIYLAGNPVFGDLLWKRALLTLLGYVICGGILFAKHRTKNPDDRFVTLVKNFSLTNKKTQWQLQLAVGVGLLLAIGTLFGLKRTMWAAFACGSILGCYNATSDGVKERFSKRMIGTLVGTLTFFVVYQIMPESMYSLFGLMGGIILGFCTDYKYKTASNSLGALLVATGVYGLHQSVILRVMNNFLGVAFGCLFLFLFQKLMQKCFRESAAAESVGA